MIVKWPVTIPALTGKNHRRSAYVYLPELLREKPGARYPVLYMFDGHNVFFDEDATYGKSWGMAEYLDRTKAPLIVAAVECNHSPDHGRLSEYSPFTFDDRRFGHVHGRGRITMDWLVNVFKPAIDRRFPTLPGREHTFIAGSSMGGLMSLYALCRYNSVFSRAAALSPSLWVDSAKLRRLIREADFGDGTVLYMDYGEMELAGRKGARELFGQTAALLMKRQVMVNCRIVPGGEHNEASWEKQIPFFIPSLLYGGTQQQGGGLDGDPIL